MNLYLQLFFEFFKTGLFAVGGGMATLPFLEDMSERTGWFTAAQLADLIAVSESTPGPIGVNMATYVGFTTGGVVGGVVASLGLVMPSLIVKEKSINGETYKHFNQSVNINQRNTQKFNLR